MATIRKLTFINDGYYHIFNRGLDRRDTFLNKREYSRALDLLIFYQYTSIPLRFSRYMLLPEEQQMTLQNTMHASGKIVEVVAYCLMPNHFHLLIKQRKEKGITTYVSNFINAYTKYFNTKHDRIGPLFQGVFKAVYVESEEQLTHLTRYIHLNPVTSSLIKPEDLATYPWSSYAPYIQCRANELIDVSTIKTIFELVPDYRRFVSDQISYAKELHAIKHLTLEV